MNTRTTSRDEKEKLYELVDLRDEMLMLLAQMEEVIEDIGGGVERQAKAYWLSSVRANLTDNHDLVGAGSMTTFEDTYRKINENIKELETLEDARKDFS
jgi:hypothetical protein